MNVVAGWMQKEMNMFGADSLDHDARYSYADEWMEKLKRRDARQIFTNIAELNAWLKRHGYRPIDPNAPPMTDEEARKFFDGCEKDEDGNYLLSDPEEDD